MSKPDKHVMDNDRCPECGGMYAVMGGRVHRCVGRREPVDLGGGGESRPAGNALRSDGGDPASAALPLRGGNSSGKVSAETSTAKPKASAGVASGPSKTTTYEYRTPEKRREYMREYMRNLRAEKRRQRERKGG